VRIGWVREVRRSKRLTGQIIAWKPNAKRPRRRPRQKWAGRIKEELKILEVRNVEETARWRRLETICCRGKGP